MSWVSTLRVRTLPAASAPVIVGTAIAYSIGGFDLLPALAALAGALFLQIGTNLANDYYDHKKGADDNRVGPARASGTTIPPTQVKFAAFSAFGLALLVGTYLALHAGWPVLVIGIAGLISGWAYTGGPFPLAYNGLGDLFAFIFFGPVAVAGTTFVQTGTWEPAAILWGASLGLLTTAILVVNNLRDRPTDGPVGKNTLAVRFGDRFSQWEWTVCVTGAFGLAGLAAYVLQNPWFLLPFAALVAVPSTAKIIWGDITPRAGLNPALGGTARILLLFAILVSVGLLL